MRRDNIGMAKSCSSGTVVPVLLLVCFFTVQVCSQLNDPFTCNDPGTSCRGFLYYTLGLDDSLDSVAALFNVQQNDIFQDSESEARGSVYVSVNCSCSGQDSYLAYAPYRVTSTSETADFLTSLSGPFKGLAYASDSRTVSVGQYVSVSLYCGCRSSTPTLSMLSYVIQSPDTINKLMAQFHSNMSDFVSLNNVSNIDLILTGYMYYIPINTAAVTHTTSLPPTAPSEPPAEVIGSTGKGKGKGGISMPAVVGIAVAGVVLIGAVVAFFIFARKKKSRNESKDRSLSHDVDNTSSDFSFSRSCSLLLECAHHSSRQKAQHPRNINAGAKRPVTLSKEMMNGVFGEKPVVFSYEEIVAATESFKESRQLGRGAFGSVYHGLLRDQEVAIKMMKATKTREFLAELKVLCKVHHTNLVELIGYSVSEEDLFLVYEYAENKAVSDRLHNPLTKGYTPLSWNARVQIALDAARGLEYIHEHTKSHYVHRDIKTSNILLDSYFRAKVADFGLAKLVEQAVDGVAATTRVVGTFGYLAPEYLRDGQATSKSDVYAFGVVLFELITGQEAISRSKVVTGSQNDRQSLISIMLDLLESCTPYSLGKLKKCVDPHMQENFPHDSVYRMAMLGRQCVEEDPVVRPNMKDVVFSLSQILLSSIEWEATLAGNSQVFSGLLQGR